MLPKLKGGGTHLHLNIQDTDPSLLSHILDGLDAGSVMVASELSVLYEAILIDQREKGVFGGEVVFTAMLLAGAWLSGSVCITSRSVRGNLCLAAARGTVRETEKPKVSGWSAKRRLRTVDLPEPEGPEITMGRCVLMAEWRWVISRCLMANAWFPSYLMAPLCATVRAQVEGVENARAANQQSEENDARG